MNRLISLDLPITRYEMTKDEARKYYEAKGYFDKSKFYSQIRPLLYNFPSWPH